MKFLKKLFGIKEQPKEEKQKAYEPIRGISVPLPDNKYTRDNIDPNIKSNNVEIDRTPSPRKHYKPKKQTSFFVVGTQHYNLQEKVNEHIKSHKRKTYQTSTSVREVIEDYGQIYKYSPMTSKRVKLIPEPENEYDNNAIAVHFRNTKIGHIKSSDTELVKKYLDDDKSYKAKILGGPFKELDYDEIVEVNGQFKMEIIFD